jgi:Recombination, repair and ssDNA binding protein UvsY
LNLEQVLNEWETDSRIDPTNLGEESSKIAQVHHKYLKELTSARLAYKQLLIKQKELRKDKYEFLTQGPFKGDDRGWKLPASGQILKADIPMYLDADPDMTKIQQQIDYHQEKMEVLVGIIYQLNNRNWQIKNSIEWLKFKSGG